MPDVQVKYPDIEVQLTGVNGNAYAILGKVRTALKEAGVPIEVRREFSVEAMSGDYDNLLVVCTRWVEVS